MSSYAALNISTTTMTGVTKKERDNMAQDPSLTEHRLLLTLSSH